MAMRYPGGFISSTAPTVNANTAKGVWTLEEAMQYIRAGQWPVPTGNGDPYFQYNTMLLPGQGTNGAQNNTFLDSSSNNFTITRNGNTTQGTFTPFSGADGYWSNYFDGSGDYLNAAAAQTNLYLNGVDSTIEGWFYLNAAPGGAGSSAIFVVQGNGAWDQGIQLNYWITADSTSIYAGGGGVGAYASAPVSNLPINQWFHLAVVYSSGTSATIYVNGRSVGSGSVTAIGSNSSYTTNVGGPFRSGAGAGSLSYLNGYASNVRIVKGSQVYTSNFTPSTTPLTAVSGTSLLTCQSNRFIDNSSNAFALTANGNVAVTPFQPFGAPTNAYSTSTVGGSGYFDGTGDYLSITDQTAFNLNTNDFTLEGWFYATGYPNYARPFGQSTEGAGGNNSIGFFFDTGGNGATIVMRWGTTANQTNDSPYITINAGKNQWHHLVATRDGNTLRMYFDGVQVYSTSVAGLTFYNSTADFRIGASSNATAGEFWQGYLSGVRLVNGTCLYPNGTTFTLPTTPPTAITNTALLVNYTNAGIIDNAQDNNLETVGNAQISTTQYKWGASSMYFDGTGDYLQVPSKQDLNYGSGDFTFETWLYVSTFPSWGSIGTIISNRANGSSFTGNIFLATTNQSSSNKIKIWASSSGSSHDIFNEVDVATGLPTNTWFHFAITKTSGTWKAFVNGNQTWSAASSSTLYSNTSSTYIGADSNGNGFTGYMADMRITKGYARYPYNFTAPTAAFPLFWQAAATPSSDPYFENTTLLLPGNGTNGAQNNTFLDSSANAFTITRNGNTTQGTFTPFSQTGWGNYFAGSQSISAAASTDFQFAGDFTIESWIYPTTTGADNFFIQNSGSNYFAVNVNAGTGFEVFLNSSTSTFSPTDIVPPLNQWSHIALVRSGSTVKLYLNGVASTTTSTNSSTVGYNAIFYVGAFGTSSTGPFVGYASNFRAVNGTAVYTTNFTPPTSPLSAITNTKLLTCQSNRFIDNSSGAKAITLNGSPTIEAFSPFNPTAAYSTSTVGGSGYFDGSGDYLTTPSSSQFAPAGDFTIGVWFYPTSLAAAYSTPLGNFTGNNSTDWLIEIESNGKLNFYTNGSTIRIASSSGAIKANQWQYIALCRSGSTITGYLNGTSVGTYSQSGTFGSASKAIGIGARPDAQSPVTGYVSSVILLDGTVTTTVPSAPSTAVSGTSLLCNFTNGGIIDNTAKNNLETVGNASISTTVSKFGGSSMYFDGTGDYLVARGTSTLNVGSGDFTIEGWFYTTSASTQQAIVNAWNSIQFQVEISSSGKVQFAFAPYSTASYLIVGNTTITANIWNHFAVVRYGSTFILYLNGVSDGTGTSSATTSTNVDLWVGANYGGTRYLNGYINDLRITKGIARYTQNFTPPTTAFLTL